MTQLATLALKFGLIPVYLYEFVRPGGNEYYTTHPSGYTTTTADISGTVTVTTVEPTSETTINVTTAAGASVDLAAGDQIAIAGDANSPYTVASAASIGASTTGDIVIEAPGLVQATVGGEAVTSTETWLHKKAIAHNKIVHTSDLNRQKIEITLPNSDSFAREFLGPILVEDTVVIIKRLFDNDADKEAVVLFRGRWVSTDPASDIITLNFENEITAFRRKGQTQVMQRPCRHAHYHTGCGLTRANFELTGTATAYDTSTNVVTVTEATGQAAPQNDFRFGVFRFGTALAMITAHSGTSITLQNVMPGLDDEITGMGSATVYLAPGCNLSRTRCAEFANIVGTVTVTTVEPTTETTINLTTAAASSVEVKAGDVIDIAGDDNGPYVVASAASIGASTTGDIVIEAPGLGQATVGGEAVTSTNLVNHGGFPLMGESPFDGRQLI